MKRFVFSIFTVLVLAPCGFAIIDANLNDVSDLWERNFNNGSLFDGSFDPQADDDSDGWSNLQEASAGTNPFDANPPDGIVQLLTGHTAEVRSEPDEYGSSYIITPEAVTVSWPTLVGKQYTLLFSPDLSAGSWVPIGDAFIGNGNEVTYGFTIYDSDKRFWRVSVCDVDSDNDGLTNHEEYLSGTNPATADSDSDGLTDLYELGLGTSPVNADSDGDGMSDYYESNNNFNPNNSGDADIDSDGDGLSNLQESILGTDPNSPDDHSDVGDEAVVNGSFSEPAIFVPGPDGKGTTGLEATKGEAGWNYWAGIPGWKAVQGENVELQTFATGPEDPNVELKAQPQGHRGIKQWIKTRVGVSYLVMFKALPRPYIGDASLNNFEVYADEERIKEITYTGEVDPDTVEWEKHTAVFTAQQVLTKLSFVVSDSNLDNTLGCIVDEIVLLPVDIAVDADRNGEIELEFDQTSAATPYRFWINNDQDDVEADEPSEVATSDSGDEQITTKRDLEDFTRIRLSVDLPLDELKDGSWKMGLKFKATGGQAPAIRIWPNESDTGRDSFLYDHSAAESQIAKQSFGEIDGGAVFIPTSYWQDRSDSEAHLIFEGIRKGVGELVLILQNGSEGPEIESSTVHLKFLDVREMFQRARIINSADNIPNPWTDDTPPPQTWVWDPWDWSYDEDPEAEEITAIFVHGWRLTYNEYLNWAQTSYKRLWHQGFKGKFYTFRWATLSGDQSSFEGYLTYNPSEYRAWLCGPALASWVNSLPHSSTNKNLFAHSMGNVISGSALRSGMVVERYALCNAAMASMAYDSGTHLKINSVTGQPWDRIWGNLGPQKTPDTDPSATIRNAYGLENKFNDGNNLPQMVNFYLRDDSALESWIDNNRFFKPDDNGHSYYYQETPIPPNISYKLFQVPPMGNPREVTSPPEAFGYVTKALTRTAGSDPRTGGSIGSSLNMDDWGVGANHSGFGETHSAQWRWSNQSTSHFWEKLCEELELIE